MSPFSKSTEIWGILHCKWVLLGSNKAWRWFVSHKVFGNRFFSDYRNSHTGWLPPYVYATSYGLLPIETLLYLMHPTKPRISLHIYSVWPEFFLRSLEKTRLLFKCVGVILTSIKRHEVVSILIQLWGRKFEFFILTQKLPCSMAHLL